MREAFGGSLLQTRHYMYLCGCVLLLPRVYKRRYVQLRSESICGPARPDPPVPKAVRTQALYKIGDEICNPCTLSKSRIARSLAWCKIVDGICNSCTLSNNRVARSLVWCKIVVGICNSCTLSNSRVARSLVWCKIGNEICKSCTVSNKRCARA